MFIHHLFKIWNIYWLANILKCNNNQNLEITKWPDCQPWITKMELIFFYISLINKRQIKKAKKSTHFWTVLD